MRVCLENLPRVWLDLRESSSASGRPEQELKASVAQAFGCRGPEEFDLLPPPRAVDSPSAFARWTHGLQGAGGSSDVSSSGSPPAPYTLRVKSARLQEEVKAIEEFFASHRIFENDDSEVCYAQLASRSKVPLLRLHRVLMPACGFVVAQWFEDCLNELEEVARILDDELQRAALRRVWKRVREPVMATFPKLGRDLEAKYPEGLTGETPSDRLQCASGVFSWVLDQIRVFLLGATLRGFQRSACDVGRSHLGTRRILRVTHEGQSASKVFLGLGRHDVAGSGTSSSSTTSPSALTGHGLYTQVMKFFDEENVQVKNKLDGRALSLEKLHEPVLRQLIGASDRGLCVELLASSWEPKPGTFDYLYRQVLRILGPRHFKLDQSYRLVLPYAQEKEVTTAVGNAIITSVVAIPYSYLDGKQMYYFKSTASRQCKAQLRTFDEFLDLLKALVSVYDKLTSDLGPKQSELLRSAFGGAGSTPMEIFDGLTTRTCSRWWASICANNNASLYGVPGVLAEVDRGRYLEYEHIKRFFARNHLDSSKAILPAQGEHLSMVMWEQGLWNLAVGGLVGAVFGVLEGSAVASATRTGSNRLGGPSERDIVVERIAWRACYGVSVNILRHYLLHFAENWMQLGRTFRPHPQVVVFLGSTAWAVFSHYRYVESRRRFWQKELTTADSWVLSVIVANASFCGLATTTGGFLGGLLGTLAGSMAPLLINLFFLTWDWWQEKSRRQKMKEAALRTLGLPEFSELGVDAFKPMLSARYKLLAFYMHPDKNDSSCCDTTMIFSQIRVAKEILEQELKDYQDCDRLRRLSSQMADLHGYQRQKFVSSHPSGVIMQILDGIVAEPDLPTSARSSLTTEESRSIPDSDCSDASPLASRAGDAGRRSALSPAPQDTCLGATKQPGEGDQRDSVHSSDAWVYVEDAVPGGGFPGGLTVHRQGT
mmetsp:Transcript_56318/g.131994  ORF Transcript_56318/g.131994 Transcript_56318/m.131994 type:complete len:940 (-) Transcript_56318:101-2920(-)